MLRLNRSFRRLWTAVAVSSFGSALTEVALPLIALFVVGVSSFELGALVSIEQVAWLLFGLVAGVWVDRWSRRMVLIATDACRALLVAVVPIAVWTGTVRIWLLLVVGLLVGICNVFAGVASAAILPEVVEKADLVAANSRVNATSTAASLSGSGAAGPVVGLLGAPAALVVDAVSFVASAALVSRVHVSRPASAPATSPFRRQLADGVRLVVTEPLFRALTLGSAAYNMCVAAQYVTTFLFLRELHTPKIWYGPLLAAGGLGGLAGSAILPRLSRRWSEASIWRAALLWGPVAGLCVPLAEPGLGLVPFVVGIFGLCAAVAISSIIGFSARQAMCPPDSLGRVAATTRMITWGVIPIGAMLGGWSAGTIGPRATLWVVAGLFFAEPLIMRLTKMWNWTGIAVDADAGGPVPERAALD